MPRANHDQDIGTPGDEHLENLWEDEQRAAHFEPQRVTVCDMNRVGLHPLG